MATLAPQEITRSGLVPAFAAAAGGGDKFLRGGGSRYVEVINGGVGSINVTIESQAQPGPGEAVADEVVAVANGARKKIGPFPEAFEDADGYVNLTYSGVTSVTVGVFDLA